MLVKRFQKHSGDPEFKKLSERLEALRERAEAGLITSIEFVKELCKIARDTVATEKAKEAAAAEKTPQAALTELFQSVKTDDTPVVVERIVEDILEFYVSIDLVVESRGVYVDLNVRNGRRMLNFGDASAATTQTATTVSRGKCTNSNDAVGACILRTSP